MADRGPLSLPQTIKFSYKLDSLRQEHYLDNKYDYMALAYQAISELVPDVEYILIRSDIHTTTRMGTRPDGPHLTVSYKRKYEWDNDLHWTAHVYTTSPSSLDFDHITAKGLTDDTFQARGAKDVAWPEWLKDYRYIEEVDYTDMLAYLGWD